MVLCCVWVMLPFAVQAADFDKKEVAYGQHETQQLDVYSRVADGVRNKPVMVYVHGGAWKLGDKKLSEDKASFYVDNGAVLVSLNYRLSGVKKHPAQIEDIAAAVAWVKRHIAAYGGNPENMVLSGHSAGAHLVALLTTDERYLRKYGLDAGMFKAVVPVDTASYDFNTKPKGRGRRMVQKMIDFNFGKDRQQLALASPSYHAARSQGGNVPYYYIAVTGERPDAVAQSEEFAAHLRKVGRKAEVHILDGLSHRDMRQALFDARSALGTNVMRLLKGR